MSTQPTIGGLHRPAVAVPAPSVGAADDWRFIDELILPGGEDFPPLGPVAEYAGQEATIRLDEPRIPAALEEMIRRDTAPLPARFDRESYCADRHYDYWLAGLNDCLRIRDAAAAAGVPIDPAMGVLDVGCSTGRVIRHFHFQLGLREVWGAEINMRNVWWTHKHLPPAFKVILNTSLPHLPLPDSSFSLVYAISVFTHIDHLELPWLLELRRVLKPGGVLIVSVHTENTWNLLDSRHGLYANLIKRGGRGEVVEGPVTEETFRNPMPSERVVFTYRDRYLYHCNVFHTQEYVRRTWGRFFEIVEMRAGGFRPHDMIVLRRPAD